MNILMLTMALGIGGAETHILELARELVRRGDSVTVASRGGVFVPALEDAGAHHIEAPLDSKTPAALFSAYRTLSAAIRGGDFDLIHAHARIPGVLGDLLAKRYDMPFVTTFHGVFDPVWYWRMLTKTGEATLAVSDDIRDYLRKYYSVPDGRIVQTVNGIDVDRFGAAVPEAEFTDRAPDGTPYRNVICVSRLDRAAAWHVFRTIEAMPDVLDACPQARLIVVGGGDVLDEVRTLAEETDEALGGGRIVVTGPRSDVDKILPAGEVFVGVSRAAMEAMACRLPVVLTGAQGHLGVLTPENEAEAISTNLCCRGREPGGAEEIGAGIISVLNKTDEERRAMGEYGRALIVKNYSVARMADDAQGLYRRIMRTHVYRRGEAVVSGYYGFGNAGDDALLEVIADGLRARGIRRVSALSRTKRPPAPGVKGVPRFRFFAVAREIRRAKLLVSGGGSLLQDATSTKSLMYYAGVIRLAHFFRVPTAILANGIGPLTKRANRRRAVKAALCADSISVRDPASAKELTEMGVPAERIRVTADPVLGAPAPEAVPAEKPYLAVSVRETADGRSSAAAEAVLAEALTAFARSEARRIVLMPMQEEYDTAVCRRTAERLRSAGADAVLCEDNSAENLRRVIAGAECVVSMRLHGLIFAFSAGTPSLALSYDPKIDALMDYFGEADRVLPAFETDAAALTAALTRLWQDREAVSQAILRRLDELRPLCAEDLDAAVRLAVR